MKTRTAKARRENKYSTVLALTGFIIPGKDYMISEVLAGDKKCVLISEIDSNPRRC